MLQRVPLPSVGDAGAVAPLHTHSGTGRADPLVITPPDSDGPKVQMVSPLDATGATVLVVPLPSAHGILSLLIAALGVLGAEAKALVIA